MGSIYDLGYNMPFGYNNVGAYNFPLRNDSLGLYNNYTNVMNSSTPMDFGAFRRPQTQVAQNTQNTQDTQSANKSILAIVGLIGLGILGVATHKTFKFNTLIEKQGLKDLNKVDSKNIFLRNLNIANWFGGKENSQKLAELGWSQVKDADKLYKSASGDVLYLDSNKIFNLKDGKKLSIKEVPVADALQAKPVHTEPVHTETQAPEKAAQDSVTAEKTSKVNTETSPKPEGSPEDVRISTNRSGEVIKEYTDSNGTVIKETTNLFGDVVTKEYTGSNGTVITEKLIKEYGKNNVDRSFKVTKILMPDGSQKATYTKAGSNTLPDFTEFTDALGKPTKTVYYNAEGKVNEVAIYREGSKDEKRILDFDEDGKIKDIIHNEYNGVSFHGSMKREYGKDRKLTKTTIYDVFGKVKS